MNRKIKIILFFATQALFNLGANFAHAVTPTFFQSLGLGDYMFGVALASMMIVNFFVSPFWGKINDYISSKTSMLICCCGYGLGQLFFGLAKTEGQVIGARMFAGLFTAGAFVSVLTYMVNTAEDEKQRGVFLAISATIQSVCNAFGYLVGGVIGEVSVFAVFVIQAITLALCGLSFFAVCEKDAKIGMAGIKVSKILKESNPFSAFLASRKFMSLTLAALFLVALLQNSGNTAFDQSFNYFLRDQFNFTSGYNGVIKGAMGLITLIVNSTITLWILNKTDIRKSITYVLGLASAAMAGAIVFSASPVPYIGINVFYFALTAVTLPIIQNLVAKSATGENSNLVMGFYNAVKSLGGIIGAMLAGVLYDKMPLYPFIYGLLAYMLACGFSRVYYKRDRVESLN